MHKKLLQFTLIALVLTSLVACSQPEKSIQAAVLSQVSIRETLSEPDPQLAAEKIYETLPNSSHSEMDEDTLMDLVAVDKEDTADFVAYRSDAKSGLSDVIFVKPKDDVRDQVRESLYQYKATREDEFKNYDILNASEIAENAIVYDQGEYLVMLMLPDNAVAQDIIDSYIPQ